MNKDNPEVIGDVKKKGKICTICGERLRRVQYFQHMRAAHRSHFPLQCGFCVFMAKDRNQMIHHIRLKHQTTDYRIHEAITLKASLNQDVKEIPLTSGFKNENHQCIPSEMICPICDKKFKYVGNLKRHLLYHSNQKLKCSSCEFISSTSSQIIRHSKKNHPNLQPKFVQIKVKSNNQEVLVDNIEFYTNFIQKKHGPCKLEKNKWNRQYRCPHCTYTCNYNSSYNRHLRVHKGTKTYKCGHCDYYGRETYEVRRHSYKVHPNEEVIIEANKNVIAPYRYNHKHPNNSSFKTSSSDEEHIDEPKSIASPNIKSREPNAVNYSTSLDLSNNNESTEASKQTTSSNTNTRHISKVENILGKDRFYTSLGKKKHKDKVIKNYALNETKSKNVEYDNIYSIKNVNKSMKPYVEKYNEENKHIEQNTSDLNLSNNCITILTDGKYNNESNILVKSNCESKTKIIEKAFISSTNGGNIADKTLAFISSTESDLVSGTTLPESITICVNTSKYNSSGNVSYYIEVNDSNTLPELTCNYKVPSPFVTNDDNSKIMKDSTLSNGDILIVGKDSVKKLDHKILQKCMLENENSKVLNSNYETKRFNQALFCEKTIELEESIIGGSTKLKVQKIMNEPSYIKKSPSDELENNLQSHIVFLTESRVQKLSNPISANTAIMTRDILSLDYKNKEYFSPEKVRKLMNKVDKDRVQCLLCHVTTKYRAFYKHAKKHFNIKPFKCGHCRYRSIEKSKIRVHNAFCHPEKDCVILKLDPENAASFSCENEDPISKGINISDSTKETNINTQKDMTNGQSGKSDLQFSVKNQFKSETQNKKNNRKSNFKCMFCNKELQYHAPSLRRHFYSHIGYKAFKCGYCSFTAISQGEVRCHNITHGLNKPSKIEQTGAKLTDKLKKQLQIYLNSNFDSKDYRELKYMNVLHQKSK